MKRGNGGELPSRSFLSRVYKTRNKTDRHRSICELDVLFFFKKEGERGVVTHAFSFFFFLFEQEKKQKKHFFSISRWFKGKKRTGKKGKMGKRGKAFSLLAQVGSIKEKEWEASAESPTTTTLNPLSAPKSTKKKETCPPKKKKSHSPRFILVLSPPRDSISYFSFSAVFLRGWRERDDP